MRKEWRSGFYEEERFSIMNKLSFSLGGRGRLRVDSSERSGSERLGMLSSNFEIIEISSASAVGTVRGLLSPLLEALEMEVMSRVVAAGQSDQQLRFLFPWSVICKIQRHFI